MLVHLWLCSCAAALHIPGLFLASYLQQNAQPSSACDKPIDREWRPLCKPNDQSSATSFVDSPTTQIHTTLARQLQPSCHQSPGVTTMHSSPSRDSREHTHLHRSNPPHHNGPQFITPTIASLALPLLCSKPQPALRTYATAASLRRSGSPVPHCQSPLAALPNDRPRLLLRAQEPTQRSPPQLGSNFHSSVAAVPAGREREHRHVPSEHAM